MKDWMYLEVRWEVKLVCDRRDLLDDSVWANIAMLQFLGRSTGLGCKIDVRR